MPSVIYKDHRGNRLPSVTTIIGRFKESGGLTPLAAGRRFRSWRGGTAGEIASKNNQSSYHENDY